MNQLTERIRDILGKHQSRISSEEHVVPAAVLIPLLLKDDQLHVLLTVRTEKVEVHKGQISFPGGAAEAGDRDLLATALRETEEEVGIRPADVTILGQLDQLITVTDFIVTPFVGLIPHPYDYVLNCDETEELLEVPLAFFLDPANMRTEQREFRGRDITVHFFDYGCYLIWGVTARILMGFLNLLRDGGGIDFDRYPFNGAARTG